ncbi:MAG: hypothetical protein Q9181_004185 [Wetmoreana brouardii]
MDSPSSSSETTDGSVLYTPDYDSDSDPFFDHSNGPTSASIIAEGFAHSHSSLASHHRSGGSASMVGATRTTDWAEQQSSQSSGLSYAPESKVKSTSQASNQADPAGVVIRTRPNMARTYSIATLLKLGQMKQPAHIELRINPAALTGKVSTSLPATVKTTLLFAARSRLWSDLTFAPSAENIFKVASSNPRCKQQETLRARAHTHSSNPTGRSSNSEEAALYDGTFVRPIRQPYNPPELSLIQKHAGFARFLKQHASPPHHRVTAGGRIVPAGPQSPPPMMLLPSINAIITNPSSKAFSDSQNNLPETSAKASGKAPLAPSIGPLAPQNININAQKSFEFLQQASQGTSTTVNAQNTQIQVPLMNLSGTNLGPLPAGAAPIGFLPDGSPLVYFNGVNYQSFWDGHSTTLRPLQLPTSAPMQMSYNAMPYPQATAGAHYNGLYGSGGPAHAQDASSSLRGTTTFSYAQDPTQQLNLAQPENTHQLHDQLANELTALDKYAALHLHEFSPAENEHYTVRRRQLVEQLDFLRVSKENTEPPNPNTAPMFGVQTTLPCGPSTSFMGGAAIPYRSAGSRNHFSKTPETPNLLESAPSHLPGFGLNSRLAPPETPVTKSLSPDAPPFVPARAKPAVPGPASTNQPSGGHGGSHREDDGTKGLNLSHRLHDQGGISNQLGVNVPMSSGNSRTGSKPVVDSFRSGSDFQNAEVLPTVTPAEIEYATRPGINPPYSSKMYCTTVEEFEEVLRRVREQAQLYGCLGGQSKDPAYDAEQDVRWAMADREPIPLPKSPADHVANPRPWSWDDSAFNPRPLVVINPSWAPDRVGHKSFQQTSSFMSNMPRPRADSWNTDPEMEGSAYRTQNFFVNSPPWKQRLPYGGDDVGLPHDHEYGDKFVDQNHSGARSSHLMSGGALEKGGLQQTGNLNEASGSYAKHGLNSKDHGAQRQPYIENTPETLAKSKKYCGYPAADVNFVEQSQGKEQLWSFQSREVTGRDPGTSQPWRKRKDSWDTNSDTSNDWARNAAAKIVPGVAPYLPGSNAQDIRPWPNPHGGLCAESDALSFDSQGVPCSTSHYTKRIVSDTWRAAKVNLPPVHGYSEAFSAPTSAREQHPIELHPAVNFAKLPNDDTSQGFLRGMLKSPRYSATRVHQSEPFDLVQHQIQVNKHADEKYSKRHANKENVKSEGYPDAAHGFGGGLGKSSYNSFNNYPSMDQDAFANKARSSLAASSYHAMARLPQYDGAGDALSSSSRGARSALPQNDGSASRLGGEKDVPAGSAQNGVHVEYFSRLEQAKLYDVGSTDKYDYRGLTRKEFSVAPDRPSKPRIHNGSVDRYFLDLGEEEFREMSATGNLDASSHRLL